MAASGMDPVKNAAGKADRAEARATAIKQDNRSRAVRQHARDRHAI